MRIIKRYDNRKLYDTTTSKTVTLSDIAQMIKEGEEDIKIIDSSEKDITTRVFAQIFLQENWETKHLFLNKFLLEGLIKESSNRIENLIKKLLLGGIGLASLTQEKLENITNELIKRGELAEDEKALFIKEIIEKMEKSSKDIIEKVEKSSKGFQEIVEKVIHGNGKKEKIEIKPEDLIQKENTIAELQKKINELNQQIEELKLEKQKKQTTKSS